MLRARNEVQTGGVTRARIYLLSYMTGLRKGEIASLTRANFQLDGEHPMLIVEVKHSKHRKKDTLPLHIDLVAEVRNWLSGLEVDQPLFPLLGKRKAYKMIQRDLEEAEIPARQKRDWPTFTQPVVIRTSPSYSAAASR